MKLPQSNPTMKAPLSLFVAGAFGLLALSNSAQAVVTVTFAQDGFNVTATLSGSILLPEVANMTLDDGYLAGPSLLTGSTTSLSAGVTNVSPQDAYNGGQSFASGLSQTPDSFSGLVSFGYTDGFLIVDGASSPGGTVTPTGVWTWNNTTLAGIGLGSLTAIPVIVYGAAPKSSDDTIQFVAVPEPSATALLGFGGVVLLSRRRRPA